MDPLGLGPVWTTIRRLNPKVVDAMGQADPENGKLTISSGEEDGAGRWKRFGVTALILAVVLLVAGLFVARTEGVRQLVEDRLVKWLGVDVTIARTRIGFPYDLVLENIESAGFDGHRAGLRVREVRIGPGRPWRVVVDGAELVLVLDGQGTWNPPVWSPFGNLPIRNVIELSRLTRDWRGRATMRSLNGHVKWLNATGRPMAAARGVDFSLARVSLPGRRMFHYRLSVRDMFCPCGDSVHDVVQREWLSGEGADDVLISLALPDMKACCQSFWSPGTGPGRKRNTVPTGEGDGQGEGGGDA